MSNMNFNSEINVIRLTFILEQCAFKPTSVKEICELLNLRDDTVREYFKHLRRSKKIYIKHYKMIDKYWTPFYLVGNKKNAELKDYRLDDCHYRSVKRKNDQARMARARAAKGIVAVKPKKFVPHPDIASAWLFNKVEL